MKIIPNIYVKVRKLWNTMFGKDGDGDEVKLVGTIKGATGQVEAGTNMELSNNKLNCKVIGNPTLSGNEPALSGLQVGSDKFSVPEVVANPTMAGTEENLTGIQVGTTKYKIPSGGGGKYKHDIYIQASGVVSVYISLILAQATPIADGTELKTIIEGLGYISEGTTEVTDEYCLPCVGAKSAGSTNTWYYCVGCAGGYEDHRLQFKGLQCQSGSFTSYIGTLYSNYVKDTVTPL